MKFVIDSIHAVEAALTTAFRWLVSSFDRVVDWLKEIFNWDNILHVKDVMGTFIGQFMTNVKTSFSGDILKQIQGLVGDGVKWMTSNVNSVFDKARAEATTPIQNLPALQAATPVGGSALTQNKAVQGYQANQVKSNTAEKHLGTYINMGGGFARSGGTALAAVPRSATTDVIAELEGIVKDLGTDFFDAFQAKLFAMKPDGLFGNSFAVFIDLIETVLDDLIKVMGEVIDLLIAGIADAVAEFESFIEAVIDIPVLSWLYKELTGHALTVLDLSCLLVAFPVVVVTATLGEDPGKLALPANMSWPSTLPTIVASDSGSAGTASEVVPRSLDNIFGIATAVVSGIYYAPIDIIGDLLACGELDQPDAFTTVVSIASLVSSAFLQAATAPVQTFQKHSHWDGLDWAAFVGWGTNFVPWFVNIYYFVKTARAPSKEERARIAKLAGVTGIFVTGIVGAVELAVAGICLASMADSQPTKGDIMAGFANLAGALPVVAKFAANPDINLADDYGPAVFLVATDAICDLAVGALSCAATYEQGA